MLILSSIFHKWNSFHHHEIQTECKRERERWNKSKSKVTYSHGTKTVIRIWAFVCICHIRNGAKNNANNMMREWVKSEVGLQCMNIINETFHIRRKYPSQTHAPNTIADMKVVWICRILWSIYKIMTFRWFNKSTVDILYGLHIAPHYPRNCEGNTYDRTEVRDTERLSVLKRAADYIQLSTTFFQHVSLFVCSSLGSIIFSP